MGSKKIIVVNPGPLYPIVGMYQVRVNNQIKSLAQTHKVDLLFLDNKEKGREETIRELSKYCNNVIPVKTFTQSLPFRILRKLVLKKLFSKMAFPSDYYTFSNSLSAKKIARKVNKHNYEMVITHYWQSAGFFKYLKNPIIKCIDTHYAVEENILLYENGKYDHFAGRNFGKLLKKEFELQKKYFALCELLIVNSSVQKKLISETFPKKKIIVTPNGQDLNYFFDYKKSEKDKVEKVILFYGALSSQFNAIALRRILDKIFPELKKKIKDLKLIVLGSNPPEWINEYLGAGDIEVTGFVDDIRPILSKSYLTLLPLQSGAGFRGRTIELMAMGVPVIGTNNALDSIEMENGKHGFIEDEDSEIIRVALDLLNNRTKRDQVSKKAINLIKEKYTLGATFGKLSEKLAKQ